MILGQVKVLECSIVQLVQEVGGMGKGETPKYAAKAAFC